MLEKVKDWVTWGEVDKDTLIELLRERGRIPGSRKLADEYIDEKLAQLNVKGGYTCFS
jgi:LSU ribosomal protein L30P